MTNAYMTITSLDDQRLAALKHEVRISNAANRLARVTENYTGSYKRERVVIYPRLGKNNPNRHLYAVGGVLHRPSNQRIRRDHGTRFDIYLTMESVVRKSDKKSVDNTILSWYNPDSWYWRNTNSIMETKETK